MSRYTEIADSLIGRIRAGKLAVGSLVPGELQLMRDYGASRHTIREALRRLEELGLIERRRGLGTRVLARKPRRAYVHRVASPDQLLRYPSESRLDVLDSSSVVIGGELAALLGCRRGSRWVKVRALRRMGPARPPICRTDVYLLPRYADIASRIGRGRRTVYELLEHHHGLHVGEVAIDVTARPMPEDAAALLGVEVGSPSMRVVRRYHDERGALIEISVSDHPGERYGFAQRLRRDWDAGVTDWTAA
jgi:DNA-binding GntR family transcriptional regulator